MRIKTLIKFSALPVFLLLVVCAFFVELPFSATQQLFFNRSVGEIYGQREVGQIFRATKSNLSAVSFRVATFGSRENNKDVVFELRKELDDSEPIRTVTVNASNFIDHQFYQFKFSPIFDSKNRIFYASLRSPGSLNGNAITIDYKSDEVYGGNNLAMVVLDNGRTGSLGSAVVKAKNDTSFMATYLVSAGEYAGLNTIRYVKNFIYSVRNDTGEY